MSKLKYLSYSLLSGLLLALSWPEIGGQFYLIFFALVPLLWLEKEISESYENSWLKVLGYSYLSFFIFNLLTTWWIYYASNWGAAAAIILNSLFMAIVFSLFHLSKKKIGKKEGYIGLIIYWVAFEYLHLNWDLSWPWLTFGNVFANQVSWVQWYEYTGVLGGSIWIIVANLLVFSAIQNQSGKGRKVFSLIVLLILILVPVIHSSNTYSNYQEEGKAIDVVIVQPNIDPYSDKFGGMAESDQIDRMVQLARSKVDANTDLLLLPETAFPAAYWEHEVEYLYGTEELRKIIQEFPQLRVIVGLSTSKLILTEAEMTPTARKLRGTGYYDNYNAAMHLDSGKNIPFHRKSKLVLGVEKVPFLEYLPIMKRLSIDLGGAAGGYGWQDKPSVFFEQDEQDGLGPIICYESIYGEYVNQYAQQGAKAYTIITNDGWWDDTPGYKQHLAYARLRAIEGRRSIARSANTGISAFINQKGEVFSKTNWWEQDAIVGEIQLNDEITFYVKYGDFIGRIAAFIAPLLILLTLVKKLNKTGQRLSMKNS